MDTGVGITPEDQKRIFQPFVQVDGTATRVQGGTGLGLAISQQLVEMMGGRLELESRMGEGSTFSFELDFQVDDAGRPRGGSGFNLTGLEFLVVDDNSTNRLVLREMLSTWGGRGQGGFHGPGGPGNDQPRPRSFPGPDHSGRPAPGHGRFRTGRDDQEKEAGQGQPDFDC